MKIYSSQLSNFAGSIQLNDAGFNFYYGDVHLNDMSAGYARDFTLHLDVATETFLDTYSYIGGNNNPLTIVSPEYAPYPFAGNCVIAYITTGDGGLATAEKELEDDFEFLTVYSGGSVVGYLVWGTFKVTQTDFYTPILMDTVTTCLSWNPIEGLEHTTLDYSEKIGMIS